MPMLIGRFQLFSTSKVHKDTKEMVYRMVLTGERGATFSFLGVKYIHKDHFGEIGLKDTTTLFVTVFQGSKFSGNVLGTATLYITLSDFSKQLLTLEITNVQSIRKKLYWMSQFGSFFARTIWNVYGPRLSSCSAHYHKHSEPRQKRPLRLNGCYPEIFKCITADKVGEYTL